MGIFFIGYIFFNVDHTSEEYYENGQLKSKITYNGTELASAKFYHENGKLSKEGNYMNNMMGGLWTTYDNNGILESKMQFLNGLFHGKVESYYQNGQLKESGNWYGTGSNSFRHAEHDWWYADGTIKAKRNYDNGILESEKCWNEYGREIKCDEVFFVYNIEEGLTNKIPLWLMRSSLEKTMDKLKKIGPPIPPSFK